MNAKEAKRITKNKRDDTFKAELRAKQVEIDKWKKWVKDNYKYYLNEAYDLIHKAANNGTTSAYLKLPDHKGVQMMLSDLIGELKSDGYTANYNRHVSYDYDYPDDYYNVIISWD